MSSLYLTMPSKVYIMTKNIKNGFGVAGRAGSMYKAGATPLKLNAGWALPRLPRGRVFELFKLSMFNGVPLSLDPWIKLIQLDRYIHQNEDPIGWRR